MSCDDGLTRGPDENFVADFAFGVYAEREGPNRVTELFAGTGDGRRRFVTVGLRAVNSGPAISPDGKRFVFESSESAAGGARDLYWVDIDRLVPVNLTRSSSSERDAAWSPRGDRIAFVNDRGVECSLEIMREDGSGATTLLTTAGALDLGGWSPDGTMLVAARDEPGPTGKEVQIVTVTVPSAQIVQRTSGSARRTSPVWSPDGRVIAYIRDNELWCLTLDAHGEVRVPVSVDSVLGPLSWTPDARSVIATGYSGGRPDICRITTVDSGLTVLTRLELGAREAAVLPDGRRIVYLAFNGLAYQLQMMDLLGSTPQRVTTFTVEEYGPVARPLPSTERIP